MKPKDPGLVRDLFDSVSRRYDFLNDVLSLGLHRLWKRKLLRCLSPMQGEKWADLCCGTGDMALALAKKVKPGGSVLGIDYASKPLEIAKKRATKEKSISLSWLKGDVLQTNLPSHKSL